MIVFVGLFKLIFVMFLLIVLRFMFMSCFKFLKLIFVLFFLVVFCFFFVVCMMMWVLCVVLCCVWVCVIVFEGVFDVRVNDDIVFRCVRL